MERHLMYGFADRGEKHDGENRETAELDLGVAGRVALVGRSRVGSGKGRSRGTAKYHDVAQAEADGYVNIDLYESGEGFHWVNVSLIDGTFDPAHPEILLYAPVPGEERLQLVAVEYVVPLSEPRPAGFTGSADKWREDVEEFGLWELTVWVWEHNPKGVFEYLNPRVP
jgi:hypothetical protein